MSLAVLTSDSFDRADGALSGSTLDNAGGGSESNTWTKKDASTTWVIASNRARNAAINADRVVVVESTAAVAIQRATAVTHGSDGGVIVRWRVGGGGIGTFYLAYRGANAQLFKYTGSFTQLGSTGSALSNGDSISGDADSGSNLSVYKNGVLDIGPISDATYADGKPGFYIGGTGAGIFDDFVFEVEAGGGSPSVSPSHDIRRGMKLGIGRRVNRAA